MTVLKNRVGEFEFEICSILAQLSYHIHPKIIDRIQARNHQELEYFADLFADRIDVSQYLFEASACVFPGVRRYVSGQGKLTIMMSSPFSISEKETGVTNRQKQRLCRHWD